MLLTETVTLSTGGSVGAFIIILFTIFIFFSGFVVGTFVKDDIIPHLKWKKFYSGIHKGSVIMETPSNPFYNRVLYCIEEVALQDDKRCLYFKGYKVEIDENGEMLDVWSDPYGSIREYNMKGMADVSNLYKFEIDEETSDFSLEKLY